MLIIIIVVIVVIMIIKGITSNSFASPNKIINIYFQSSSTSFT